MKNSKKRKTIEDCQNLAKLKNGKCLESKYINSKTKMRWQCFDEHIWLAPYYRVYRGSWCPICSRKRKSFKLKVYDIDDCKNTAKLKNGQCMSVIYKNIHTKIKWRCECSYIWFASYNSIKNGSWCPKCAINSIVEKMTKYTIDDCKLLAKSKNGKFLSANYKGTRKKYLWVCANGHKWRSSHETVMKHWCPYCCGNVKFSISDCQELAIIRKGECLSANYTNNRTNLKWKCNMGHIWYATFSNIKRGTWCPYCAKKTKYSIDDCHKIAKLKNGKCLSVVYTNNKEKIQWQCKNNHIWNSSFASIKKGHWCPRCKYGKSQLRLKSILENIFQETAITIRPDWLKNPETGFNLEIDIYFPKLKIAVEYQGEQHYEPIIYFGGNARFEETKKRDQIKRIIIGTKETSKYVKHYIEFPYNESLTKKNVLMFLTKKIKNINNLIQQQGENYDKSR